MANKSQKSKKTVRNNAKVDPKSIFSLGESFEYAANLLSLNVNNSLSLAASRKKQVQLPAMFPLVVNRAFSIELFLKCLILLDTDRAEHGHELLSLFNKLRSQTRRRLEELYNQEMKQDMKFDPQKLPEPYKSGLSIAGALKQCSNCFQKFRYLYEYEANHDLEPTGSVPHALRVAVKKMLLEVKPEWKHDTIPSSKCQRQSL